MCRPPKLDDTPQLNADRWAKRQLCSNGLPVTHCDLTILCDPYDTGAMRIENGDIVQVGNFYRGSIQRR